MIHSADDLDDDMAGYYGDWNMPPWEDEPRPFRPTTDAWITRAGDVVLVKDMSDEHLANTILLLHRRKSYRCLTLPRMLDEARTRNLLPLRPR